jgi:hypothetical protein
MYSTNIYIYTQKQKVLLLNPDELYKIRWRPVYTKNLRASKGVNNTILFQFMNQDQKPVDVTDMVFTLRLMNREGDTLLLKKDLVIHNAERGQAKLILLEGELDLFEAQLGNYSITVDDTTLEVPVFVDDNAGGRGVIAIEDAVYPEFLESTEITLPPQMPAASSRNFQDQEEHPTTVSSQWVPISSFQTLQYKTDTFEGEIEIQAANSAVNNGEWFDVHLVEYTDTLGTTGIYYYNIEGVFPRMRLKISTIQGSVKDVLIR